MNNLLNRITIDSELFGGRPTIRGMRIRVTDILNLLSNGLSNEQIIRELPDLELDDIKAALKYASVKFDHPVILV
ncbi:MAG: DUF433 domain-containing protein [Ignavibacteria bacterium]|nr:DUF433 domain-containing protein [Ignavibacteria bacterium]